MVVCAVSISPLPGLTLPGFASRHAAEWFHRSTEKLWYQSQFLIGLAVLSIENALLYPQISAGEIPVFLRLIMAKIITSVGFPFAELPVVVFVCSFPTCLL